MGDVDTGMPKELMKRLLAKSKQEPVNCAFAQCTDATVALLLLDRVKQPNALGKELQKRFPDLKNPRWGTAFVDVDDNPKLVKFTITKPCSGMARKLIKTLKGTGFTKAVILLEDGSTVESYNEEDEAAAPAEHARAAVPDAASLRGSLAALIGRIQAVTEPARRAELVSLANGANGHLKAGTLAEAAAAVARLQAALGAEAAPPAASPPAGGGGAVVYAKARLAWLAARRKVEGEMEKLRGSVVATYQEYGLADELEAAHAAFVAPVLAALDESLADKLDEVSNATDPAVRTALVQQARAIMQRYAAYVAGEPAIAALDANPFVALAIRPTLTATLGTLAGVVR